MIQKKNTNITQIHELTCLIYPHLLIHSFLSTIPLVKLLYFSNYFVTWQIYVCLRQSEALNSSVELIKVALANRLNFITLV